MYFQLTINQNGFSKKCKSRFFQKTKIPVNPKTKISPKHVSSNFQPLCCCSVMLKKKKEKFHALILQKNLKTSFGSNFSLICPKTSFPTKTNSFPQSLYDTVTLRKK